MKYKIKYDILNYSFLGGADQNLDVSNVSDKAKSIIKVDDIPNISNSQSLEDIVKYVNDYDSIKSMSDDLDKSFKNILQKVKGLDYKTNSRNQLDKLNNFLKKINKIESSDVPRIKDDLYKVNNEALKKISSLIRNNKEIDYLSNFVKKVNELESADVSKIKEDLYKVNDETLKKMSLLKRNNKEIDNLSNFVKKVNELESTDVSKIKEDLYKVNDETLKKMSLLKRNNKEIDYLNDFVKKINELESTDIPQIKEDLNKINSEILKKISLLKSNEDIDDVNTEILSNFVNKVNKFIEIINKASDPQKEKEIKDSLNALNIKINEKIKNIISNLNLKINNKSTELINFKNKMSDMLGLFKKINEELNHQETDLKLILDEINNITLKKLNVIKKQSEDNVKLIKSYKKIFFRQTIKYIKIIKVLYRIKNIYVDKQRKFNDYIIIIENLQNGNKYDNEPKKSNGFFDNPYIELYN